MAPIARSASSYPPDLGELGGQDLPLLANRHHWLCRLRRRDLSGRVLQAQIFRGRFGILTAEVNKYCAWESASVKT